jgi:hypothetical protein
LWRHCYLGIKDFAERQSHQNMFLSPVYFEFRTDLR